MEAAESERDSASDRQQPSLLCNSLALFLWRRNSPPGLERGLEGTPGMEERPENQRRSEEGLSHEIKRELVTHERVAEES